jgi:hypothetical protein
LGPSAESGSYGQADRPAPRTSRMVRCGWTLEADPADPPRCRRPRDVVPSGLDSCSCPQVTAHGLRGPLPHRQLRVLKGDKRKTAELLAARRGVRLRRNRRVGCQAHRRGVSTASQAAGVQRRWLGEVSPTTEASLSGTKGNAPCSCISIHRGDQDGSPSGILKEWVTAAGTHPWQAFTGNARMVAGPP